MDSRARVKAGLVIAILFLGASVGVLLANLVPLVADVVFAKEPVREVRSVITSSVSLPEASERATARAREWAQDASLIRVEGTWYLSPTWRRVNAPPVAWGFYFYSPSEKSLVSVIVDDDILLWVPPYEMPIVPQPLASFPPAQGADVAWLVFQAAGAEAFLETHPDAQITFRLQAGAETTVWIVSAYDGPEYVRIAIDAQSGVVLPQAE